MNNSNNSNDVNSQHFYAPFTTRLGARKRAEKCYCIFYIIDNGQIDFLFSSAKMKIDR